jgi:glycosyltransferase involved in cell wall biosynthesis
MKYAFLIPSFRNGGAERQFILLVRTLIARGYRASFITYSLSTSTYECPDIPSVYIPKRKKIDIRFFVTLIRYLKNENIDMLITCYQGVFEGPLLWGRLAKLFIKNLKVVTAFRRSQISLSGKVIEAVTSHMSYILLANNRKMYDTLFNMSYINESKVKYIRNIADKDTFYKYERAAQLSMREKYHKGNSDKTIFICIGSYLPVKNYIMLIETIHYLIVSNDVERMHFSIYGDKECLNSQYMVLEKIVSERKLESVVSLNGPVDNVTDLINSCDAIILPSLHEGSPNVAMESIMCEKPVIISSRSNYEKFVNHGVNGLIFSQSSIIELASCINKVKEGDFDIQQEHVELFHHKHAKENIADIFVNEILDG